MQKPNSKPASEVESMFNSSESDSHTKVTAADRLQKPQAKQQFQHNSHPCNLCDIYLLEKNELVKRISGDGAIDAGDDD